MKRRGGMKGGAGEKKKKEKRSYLRLKITGATRVVSG